MEFKINDNVIAIWDYKPKEEDELALEEEDIVKITKFDEKQQWAYGVMHGRKGWFPLNYVKKTSDQTKYSGYTTAEEDDDTPEHMEMVSEFQNQFTQPTISVVSPAANLSLRKTWADTYKDSVDMSKLSKTEVKRQESIFELYTTEESYVKDLQLILELYIKPIRTKNLLSSKDVSVIFSNIEQILPINQELLKSIKQRCSGTAVVERIGDIILSMIDYLKIYTMYCSNHPHAIMKLQGIHSKSFMKFLSQTQSLPESHNLSLSTYLIKPVQRICKYPLLLREIIKFTEDTNPDKKVLEQALSKIETVVTIVNEAARQSENVFKTLDLQQKLTTKLRIVSQSRQLMKQGNVEHIQKKKRKPRVLFAFNDVLIFVKQVNSQRNEKFELRGLIPFDEIQLSEGEDEKSFVIEHVGKDTYLCEASSEAECESWLKTLRSLLQQYKDRRNSLLNDPESSDSILSSIVPEQRSRHDKLSYKDSIFRRKRDTSPSTQSLNSTGSKSLDDLKRSTSLENLKKLVKQASDLTIEANNRRKLPEAEEGQSPIPEVSLSELREKYSSKHSSNENVKTNVSSVKVSDVLRSRGSSREFIYVLQVTKPGDEYIIFVTFDDFLDFHLQLLGHFPEEAGTRGLPRTLPDLPPQVMFVSAALARQRVTQLSDYLNGLFALPSKISRSYVVSSFLKKDGKKIASLK